MLEIFRVKEGDAVRIMPDHLRRTVQAIFEKLGVRNRTQASGALPSLALGEPARVT